MCFSGDPPLSEMTHPIAAPMAPSVQALVLMRGWEEEPVCLEGT